MRRAKELAIIFTIILLGTYLAWATVSSQTTKVYFTCNGSTTTFSCTGGNKIPCFANTDIRVYIRTDSTGVEEPLALTGDYSVSALNNDYTNGFTVTTVNAYASGKTLVVKRAIGLTQEVNLIRGRAIPQESLEKTLDRQMLALQDSREELGRSLRIPVTDSSYDMNLPSSIDRANKYMAFGATGDPTVTDGTTSDIVVSSWAETLVDDDTAATARTTMEITTANITGLISITDPPYNAVGDGITDDTTAIQAALDDAQYKTVFVPSGTYKTTSTLDVFGSTSIYGLGYISQISADGCDAFNVSISGTLASTEWSNFAIKGVNGEGKKAIKAMGTATSGEYTAGVVFSNLFIRDFGYGFYFRSTTHCVIRDCWINRVWIGIALIGQNIITTIDRCDMTLDMGAEGTIGGTGVGETTDSTGIYIDSASDYDPGGATEKMPEDIRIINTSVSAFDTGINLLTCLYATVINCDIDRLTKYGVVFVYKYGGLTIRDCWISITGTSALYGVYGLAIGTANNQPVLIEHNRFSAASSPHANSVGVYAHTKQWNIVTQYNHFDGFQSADVKYDGGRDGSIEHNNCASTDPTWSIVIDNSTGPTRVFDNKCASPLYINSATLGTELEAASLDRTASAVSTSGTGEDTLRFTNIRGNTLDKFRGINIVASGLKTTGGGNKTIKLYFGDDAITVFPAANDTVAWILEAWITNDNATNLQQVIWQFNNNGTVTMGQTNTPNQDTTADVYVKLTGECADSGDTITQNFWLVERF